LVGRDGPDHALPWDHAGDLHQRIGKSTQVPMVPEWRYGFDHSAHFRKFLSNHFTDFPLNRRAPDLYDYEADIQFLEENTQPGDVIGMTGGGVTSYLMPDRVFINLDGLINSEDYFESLKNDRSNEYLTAAGVKYIYGEEEVLLGSDPYRWVFTDHIRLLQASPSQFNLYQYCSDICQ
jgi:hypothetical protein